MLPIRSCRRCYRSARPNSKNSQKRQSGRESESFESEAVRKSLDRWIAVIFAMACMACVAVADDERSMQPVRPGDTRVYFLRPAQELYSLEPATITIDGQTLGVLGNGTFIVTDVRSGAQILTVRALASFVTAQIDLAPQATVYVTITMNPSGLVPPRGAVRSPRPLTDQPALFSIRFVDEQTGGSLLKGLSPAVNETGVSPSPVR